MTQNYWLSVTITSTIIITRDTSQLTNTWLIYSGTQEQRGEGQDVWLILLSFDVFVCVSLLLGIKVLLLFANGYFIGNLGLLEFFFKKVRVCVWERESWLGFYFIFSVMLILSSQSDMYMIKETFQFNVTSSSDTNSVSGKEDQKHFSFNLVAKVRY